MAASTASFRSKPLSRKAWWMRWSSLLLWGGAGGVGGFADHTHDTSGDAGREKEDEEEEEEEAEGGAFLKQSRSGTDYLWANVRRGQKKKIRRGCKFRKCIFFSVTLFTSMKILHDFCKPSWWLPHQLTGLQMDRSNVSVKQHLCLGLKRRIFNFPFFFFTAELLKN